MIPEESLDITGIILAGGKSSRMGQDKGLKLHDGIPFIKHIINALEPVTSNIFIITNSKEHQIFGLPCIPDIIKSQGPVGGIYTALKHTKTQQNLILSCDVPFVTSFVLENLIMQYDPDFDVITYKDNPLITLYDKRSANNFFESIQLDRLSLTKTLLTLKVKNIPVDQHIAPFIKNINTNKQYKKATQWN